eukprot:749826-Hanusia_phi.AAC.4
MSTPSSLGSDGPVSAPGSIYARRLQRRRRGFLPTRSLACCPRPSSLQSAQPVRPISSCLIDSPRLLLLTNFFCSSAFLRNNSSLSFCAAENFLPISNLSCTRAVSEKVVRWEGAP